MTDGVLPVAPGCGRVHRGATRGGLALCDDALLLMLRRMRAAGDGGITGRQALRAVAARAGLVVVSIVLTLVAAEFVITAWYGELGARGPYEVVPEWGSPFVFRSRTDGAHLNLRRSAAIALDNPAGAFRVLSYGDSIAAGFALEEPDTYAYQSEAALNATGARRVEILNMARGHSPTIYTFHLRADVPRFAPDAVLVEIELLNDVSDEARVRTAGLDTDGLPLEIHGHRYILSWDGYILGFRGFSGSPIHRTKVYAKITRAIGRLQERLDPNPLFAADSDVGFYALSVDRHLLTQAALERGFERIFESLAGIQRYLARRGIRLLVLIVPSQHVFDGGRFSASSRALVERAAARARALDLDVVLPLDALERAGGAALYMDFCHPTAAGNRTIAAALTPVLAAWSAPE